MGVGTPPDRDFVLKYALERWAQAKPERTFACFDDGDQWSYRETLARTRRLAAALQGLGVEQGDHVVVWLPNSKEGLLAFFAINYVGAVYVPINTAYRGGLLAHVIAISDARVIIAHGELVERLCEVDLANLTTLVAVGMPGSDVAGLICHDFAAIQVAAGEPREPERPIEPWSVQSIIFTSGTTCPRPPMALGQASAATFVEGTFVACTLAGPPGCETASLVAGRRVPSRRCVSSNAATSLEVLPSQPPT